MNSALPCKNQESITKQIQPTINLLTNLDALHPEILQHHDIQPIDYKGSLVFRSAIESIRGKFIASSVTQREGLVQDVMENLKGREWILDYRKTSAANRYDFEINIDRDPDYFTALEVKGGEGNSINISERPLWAKEFGVWCHLDGGIVNQPAQGAHSIINRLTNELVIRNKLVDVLFFKDILCGTRARPCPKYPGSEESMGLNTAPDIFLFPQRVPTIEDLRPPLHNLDTLRLPNLILDLFGIQDDSKNRHIWEVHVEIIRRPKGKLQRSVKIVHQGDIVDQSKSRQWRTQRI